MRFDFDNNYYVSCLHLWVLVALSLEGICMFVRHSQVDGHLNNLFIVNNLLSLAPFASIFLTHVVSLAFAVGTRSLGLSVHSRTQLLHSNHHLFAFTG